MHEVCGINIEEVETLQSFLDPDKQNEIPYNDMLRLFSEPTYLSEFARKKIPHLLDEDKFEPQPRATRDIRPVSLVGAFESVIKSSEPASSGRAGSKYASIGGGYR